jgi:hypothetical protein
MSKEYEVLDILERQFNLIINHKNKKNQNTV